MDTVLVNVANHIATITLNRPEALNALNTQMRQELVALWQRINEDDDIRMAILTGAGRAFCAGRDIKEAVKQAGEGQSTAFGGSTTASAGHFLPRQVFKPLIAAVNGGAAGIGLGLALACDFTIAAEEAIFSSPFAARGVMNAEIVALVMKKAPAGWAMWMNLSGTRVDAQTALRIGLVNEVLPQSELLDRANEMAERILSNSYVSVLAIREKMWQILEGTMGDALTVNGPFAKAWAQGGESREGFAAFAEKRNPQFE